MRRQARNDLLTGVVVPVVDVDGHEPTRSAVGRIERETVQFTGRSGLRFDRVGCPGSWVVSRTVDPAGDAPAVTSRYAYADAGDGPWAEAPRMGETMVKLADSVPTWPVMVFESDAYCHGVDSADDVPDLYEDDYWDEVMAAYDANFRPVNVERKAHVVVFEADSRSDVSGFQHWAIRSLMRSERVCFFRVRRIAPFKRAKIAQFDAARLWQELMSRT